VLLIAVTTELVAPLPRACTDWQKVRMHRSGNDFSYITDIPKGKHCYRFFVDNQWHWASDQPSVRNLDDGELCVRRSWSWSRLSLPPSSWSSSHQLWLWLCSRCDVERAIAEV
jgi:hypothetical protein